MEKSRKLTQGPPSSLSSLVVNARDILKQRNWTADYTRLCARELEMCQVGLC